MNQTNDQTAIGGCNPNFPLTEWTRLENTSYREAVLNELCECYWKPLYQYMRFRGWSNDQAKDLIQGFFTEKILGQQILTKARRQRGRFRNFLLTALRNYTINTYKKQHGKRDAQLHDWFLEPAESCEPDVIFDRIWAQALLEGILAELESECRRKDKAVHWRLFNTWVLGDEGAGAKQKMKALCAEYGIPNAGQAYKIIFKMKARFRELLRHSLKAQGAEGTEIDEEIRKFVDIFSTH